MLPDVELALTTWVRDTCDTRAVTDLPADLADVLPVVQVVAVGGSGDRFSGRPRVDIDVYAATYEDARDLAAEVHDALVLLRGTLGTLVVRDVRVDTLPSRRPYDNPALRHVGASYSISVRPVNY